MNRGTYSHESPSVLDVRDPYSAFYQGPHRGKHWYLWHPDDIGTAKPMNENIWFEAFQPLLLKVVNTGYGRQLMGIDADIPVIHKITKNAIHCHLGEDKWWAEFRIGAKWANVIRYRWPEFKRYAKFFYDMPNFFTLLNVNGVLVPAHATDTSYPDAHTESTTVDGTTRYRNDVGSANPATDAEFRTAREASNGNVDMDDSSAVTYWANADDWFYGSTYRVDVYRGIALFDTSGISGGTVTAATCSIYFVNVYDKDNDTEAYVSLVESDPASNTAVAYQGDYVKVGLDSIGGSFSLDSAVELHDGTVATGKRYDLSTDISSGGVVTGLNAYRDWTMNATGLGAVSTSGVTKLGFRHGHDLEDHPTAHMTAGGGAGASNYSHIYANAADTAGTSTDPKLVVTYSTRDTQAFNGIALGDIQAVNGITVANAQAINGITF